MGPLLDSPEVLRQRQLAAKAREKREASARRAARHNVMRGNSKPGVATAARSSELEDGVEQHASGNAMVFTVRDNSRTRREFGFHCSQNGIALTPLAGERVSVVPDTVESLTTFGQRKRTAKVVVPLRDGTYNRQTGKLETVTHTGGNDNTDGKTDEDGFPVADYLAIGDLQALERMSEDDRVLSWRWKETHKVPFKLPGSGPEKMRPSMGSAFGAPGQHASTATALALAKETRQGVETVEAVIATHVIAEERGW